MLCFQSTSRRKMYPSSSYSERHLFRYLRTYHPHLKVSRRDICKFLLFHDRLLSASTVQDRVKYWKLYNFMLSLSQAWPTWLKLLFLVQNQIKSRYSPSQLAWSAYRLCFSSNKFLATGKLCRLVIIACQLWYSSEPLHWDGYDTALVMTINIRVPNVMLGMSVFTGREKHRKETGQYFWLIIMTWSPFSRLPYIVRYETKNGWSQSIKGWYVLRFKHEAGDVTLTLLRGFFWTENTSALCKTAKLLCLLKGLCQKHITQSLLQF